ncbi:MAG: hypothetical protein GC164_08655 [Phycisphaera sp.]|nr:hypothetical protein [Phycisphaera sp.]
MSTTARNTTNTSRADARSLLAWAGWRMEVPDDWRPLKLSGTPAKGNMIIGDSLCAFFSIHWERLKNGPMLDAQGWIAQRLKKQGLLPDNRPPAAEHFSACTWSRGIQSEEDKQTTYWYGYAAPAELVIGVKVNGVLPDRELSQITDHILPSLRTSPIDADSTWAMYDLSFIAPPGFTLDKRHLFTGDIAMEFRKGRGESLLLRQVYPAELALKRRSFERWLEVYPFKEHRRLRRSTLTTEPWRYPKRERLDGLWRFGRKRLGFPLGGVASRWTTALIAHDPTVNRLLIAEHLSTQEPDRGICEEAILSMNRFEREGR